MAEAEVFPTEHHVDAGPRRTGRRQRYTPVACVRCKKRKIKCSGETPCRQCAKHGGNNCIYDRTFASNSIPPAAESRRASEYTSAQIPVTMVHSLSPLSRQETLELLDEFREDIDTLYPFIDLEALLDLTDEIYIQIERPKDEKKFVQTARWGDLVDYRNLDLLKLLLSCSLAAKGKIEEEPGRGFMQAAEARNLVRLAEADIDVKDLAIATMLAVYHYICDNVKLALRKIGGAARLSVELGLHRLSRPQIITLSNKYGNWATKMFWCIYVLDRRYSFMANLPATLSDQEIDFDSLQPDPTSPYLLPMVMFGRLGGKIIPVVPRFGSSSADLDDRTRTKLGNEIDGWVTSSENAVWQAKGIGRRASQLSLRGIDPVKIFLQIRSNQMKLSLHKHTLYSPSNIAKHQDFARIAIQSAIENIRICGLLNDNADQMDKYNAVHYRFFVISSLIPLYLAIRNAPEQFGSTSVDYLAGIKLVKSCYASSVASQKLGKMVETLENAMHSLSLGPFDVFGNTIPAEVNYAPPPAPLALVSKAPPRARQQRALEFGDHDSRQQHNFPQSTPRTIPQTMPQSIPQTMPQSIPQTMPQSIPQNVPHSIPHGMPQNIPQSMPQSMPQMQPTLVAVAPTTPEYLNDTVNQDPYVNSGLQGQVVYQEFPTNPDFDGNNFWDSPPDIVSADVGMMASDMMEPRIMSDKEMYFWAGTAPVPFAPYQTMSKPYREDGMM